MTPPKVRRRRKQNPLRVVEEHRRGNVRYKVTGYYVGGKRVRRYFLRREEANTFVQAEAIKRENLGNRAQRIDGALAEDAIRATDLLRGHKITIHDAARSAAEAAEKLAPHGATIGDAVDFYIGAIRRRAASVSVAALIDEFLKNRAAKGKSRAYIDDLQRRLVRFARELGPERIVSEVRPAEIDAWIHRLGVGPQSMNNFRAVLSAAWGFAVKRGYALENILVHIDKVRVTRDNVATFSSDEVKRLLYAAPLELLPYIAIGVFAGLRPEEIKRLRWSDVSLEDRLITVNATVSKTARKRFAEMSENLVQWLGPFAGRTGPVACRNLPKLMLEARKAAGLPTWPSDVLRHTFASAHYAHFKNPAQTALLLGHRDQQMLMNHYRNLMRPADAARYWQIMPPATHATIVAMGTAAA